MAYDPDEKNLKNTIMHEYGHYLQYKDWGAWDYLQTGWQQKGQHGSYLETNADFRSCNYFGSDRFKPAYGGGLSCAQLGYATY